MNCSICGNITPGSYDKDWELIDVCAQCMEDGLHKKKPAPKSTDIKKVNYEDGVSIHIGNLIEKLLKERNISIVDFARSITLTRAGVYKILSKKHINPMLMYKISSLLSYDLFKEYSDILGITENLSIDAFLQKFSVDDLIEMKIGAISEKITEIESDLSALRTGYNLLISLKKYTE